MGFERGGVLPAWGSPTTNSRLRFPSLVQGGIEGLLAIHTASFSGVGIVALIPLP
jgi:hypothetical protein